MHEATITIDKIWDPFKPGDKRTNVTDRGGVKWRVLCDVVKGFKDGDCVDIGFTEEEFPPGKFFNLVKSMKPANGSPATPVGRGVMGTGSSAGGASNGGGPEKGMILKLTAELRAQGMSKAEICELLWDGDDIYATYKAGRQKKALSDNIEDTF